jgi:hypothetical protein
MSLTPAQYAAQKKWKAKNKDKVNAYAKAWREKNPTKVHARTVKQEATRSLDPVYRASKAERAAQWRKDNPDRYKAAIKKWQAENPDAIRHNHYSKYYGISLERYAALVAAQNGVCAICSQPPGKRRLAVDHCHTTKAIRGLLCVNCNTAIGKLNDDPELLRRAIAYLFFYQ